MPAKEWTPEARRDIERRGGSTAGLLGKALSEPLDDSREAGTEHGENGNDRTGLLVNLSRKQITIALGIAATVATSIGAYVMRDPSKTNGQTSATAVQAEPKAEALAIQLKAHVDDVSEIQADVREVRDEVRKLRREVREDLRDMRGAIRAIERAIATGKLSPGLSAEGGGSK